MEETETLSLLLTLKRSLQDFAVIEQSRSRLQKHHNRLNSKGNLLSAVGAVKLFNAYNSSLKACESLNQYENCQRVIILQKAGFYRDQTTEVRR